MNETQRKKHKAREKRETKKGIRQTENDEQNGGIKYFPIAISDINGLNSQIQRHRVAKWTKKKKIQLHTAYKICTLGLQTHTG